MLIFFEEHKYPEELIVPYFKERDSDRFAFPIQHEPNGWCVKHVGYFFIAGKKYNGPVFILPKLFLQPDKSDPEKKDSLLGQPGLFPENIIDTDSEENILVAQGREYFLPELSLWLFRAMSRYREDCIDEEDENGLMNLDNRVSDSLSCDHDFLSTAVHLMDYLSDHRNLFTQISKVNNSGRSAVDWHKTIQKYPYIKDGKPYYLDLQIKDNTLNIDEELIILYYSVLRYLKNKFHFRIPINDIPYDTIRESEIQRYIDTGIGKRKMRDMKGKYYRDDLKSLWYLLDAFFTSNSTKDDKDTLKESLVVSNFSDVFEKMVDHLIGDTGELSHFKTQKDGKLIDHIFLEKSLIGRDSYIYYIGDSKYYPKDVHPSGTSLYKQFTYARNAIQYNINEYNLGHKKNPHSIRYRDEETEGYNVTPNFFVCPKIEIGDLDFDKPSFGPSGYTPKPNKHFEDRLFDRDTLLLREYEINLIFLIAAYGAYEDGWTTTLRKAIREDMIGFLNETYNFFEIVPNAIPVYSETRKVWDMPFLYYHHNRIIGKVYKQNDHTDKLLLAYEKNTEIGKADWAEAQEHLTSSIKGGSIDIPIKLEP